LTRSFQAVDPDALPGLLAERIHETPPTGWALRVAVDGPPCARPDLLAAAVIDPLRRLGHRVDVVDAASFWRDASLRFEYGRQDVASYREWLDAAALRREVLDPLGAGGSGQYLPSLRDPATNRSTRAPARAATARSVVIVAGELLLGRDLPFDLTVHLAVSAAARRRRTPPEGHWSLDAHDEYDRGALPLEHADVVVRLDDPAHPAVG
jgi:hypothetical protein